MKATLRSSPALNDLDNWLSSTSAVYFTAHDLAIAQAEPPKKPEINRGWLTKKMSVQKSLRNKDQHANNEKENITTANVQISTT